MEALCAACLCDGRKLYFIGETGFYILYTQILNEIPVYNQSQIFVRICWECKSMLRRFHEFKNQVKHSYMYLLKHSEQQTTPKPVEPHLQIQVVTNITTCPELQVKTEDTEVTEDPQVMLDQGPIQLQVQVDVKREQEVAETEEAEHCEPETFVNNLDLVMPKRKRVSKGAKSEKYWADIKHKSKTRLAKHRRESSGTGGGPSTEDFTEIDKKILSVIGEQAVFGDVEHRVPIFNNPIKEKPKKKIKETKKSKFKKKMKIESKKRRVSSDTLVSDVSFGRSVTPDTKEEVTRDSQTDEVVKDNAVPKVNGKVVKAPRKQSSKNELPEKPQCVECGKMFSSRKTYRYHLNVLHKGQNRYPCPRCGKIYQWKSNLGRHMRSHKARDSGELYCETCDKRFASVATYRQHLRVSRRHVPESEFSFMCNECGKKFVSKTRLRDHIDWEHLNNIKFRCQLCNKPFKCHTSLYVHMQNVHRNKEKKDNLCHVCGKSYQNAAKLKYHIVAMHTSETPYRCAHCSAAFGWYSSLYRHVREVHYKMKVQPKKTKKVKKLGSEILPSLVPQPPLLNMQPGPA